MNCWRWNCRPGKPCRRCAKTEAQERAVEHVTWFETTGHCGGCGQPGGYCLCTEARPCGCRHLHAMGSGHVPDALDQFTITETTTAEQGGLFE